MAGVYAALVLFAGGMVQSVLDMALRKLTRLAQARRSPRSSPARRHRRRRIPDSREGLRQAGPAARHHRRRGRARSSSARIRFVIARVPEGATAGELVIESGQQSSDSWACDIGVLIADNLHPVANPAVDSLRQHLHHLQRIARAEGPGGGLQDRPELQHEAVHQRADERHRPGLRRRRHALHFQPLRRLRLPGHAQRQHVGVRGRHGRGHGHRLRRRAEPLRGRPQRHHFQDQPRAARSSSSPRSSLPSPPTIWRSARTATSTSPAPPPPASIASTAFRDNGEVEVFYRGLGRPQGMAFDDEGNLYVAASIWRPQRRGAHRRRTARPSCSFPGPASWGWPSRPRAP